MELKDCVKPRLAEFGVRIGNLEAQSDKDTNDNGNGKDGLPSRKTIILVILAAAVAGGAGDKVISLALKLFGVN